MKTVKITDCNLSDCNGMYHKMNRIFDGVSFYEKDDDYQLYRYRGVWRIGKIGVKIHLVLRNCEAEEWNISELNLSENKIIIKENDDLIEKVVSNRLTYLTNANLENIKNNVLETVNLDGIIIETGCALGGSSICISHYKDYNRVLRIYDVFGMIPPPSDKDGTDIHNRYNIIESGKSGGIGNDVYYGYKENLLEEVKNNFRKLEVDLSGVEFIKGLYQDTLVVDKPVSFSHIDCDWYESVKCCLERIEPKLVEGGILTIDDYYSWSGCKTTVDEYFSDKKRNYEFYDRGGKLNIRKVKKRVVENKINIEEYLGQFGDFIYIPNPGNAGDSLIAYGTLQLFSKLGLKYEIGDIKQTYENQTLMYAGGGNLVGLYGNCREFIKRNTARGNKIILLPCTIKDETELIKKVEDVVYICRERVSYNYVYDNIPDKSNVLLADDMAFGISGLEKYKTSARGVINCFRTDSEKTDINIPRNNVDLSVKYQTVGNTSDVNRINITTEVIFRYLSNYQTVNTNRLHMAIAGSLLGKNVNFYPNSYYKNKAVYDFSIKNEFKKTKFVKLV